MSKVQFPFVGRACTRVLTGMKAHSDKVQILFGLTCPILHFSWMYVFYAGLPTHSRTCRDQAKSQMSLLLGDDCVNNAVHSLFHVMLCLGLWLTHHSMKPQFTIADCDGLPPAIVSVQTVTVVHSKFAMDACNQVTPSNMLSHAKFRCHSSAMCAKVVCLQLLPACEWSDGQHIR